MYGIERPTTTEQYFQKQNQNPYKSMHRLDRMYLYNGLLHAVRYLHFHCEREGKNPHAHRHTATRSLARSLAEEFTWQNVMNNFKRTTIFSSC